MYVCRWYVGRLVLPHWCKANTLQMCALWGYCGRVQVVAEWQHITKENICKFIENSC